MSALPFRKISSDKTIDVTALLPPVPILMAQRALNELRTGQVLCVIAPDGQTAVDFHDFSKLTGNPLQTERNEQGQLELLIQKR